MAEVKTVIHSADSASDRKKSSDKDRHNGMQELELDNTLLDIKNSKQLTQRRSALMPTSDCKKDGNKWSETAINTEDLKGEQDEVYGLTRKQIEAFREVFTLFDINGGGSIDAGELNQALMSVDISLTESELKDVLSVIDEDGNGEIDFDEFLNLMTSTEKFLATLGDKRRDSCQSILFNALTKFMRKSALSSLSEIERLDNMI